MHTKFQSEKPKGKRPLASPRRTWENNIKTDLRGIGCTAMDRKEIAQVRSKGELLGTR